MTTKTYAVDFETYYDDDLSITIQGAVNYARRTHIYMVSIYGSDVEYVGSVEDAPWHRIDECHWVSHNASFDQAVYLAAISKQQVDGTSYPSVWDCTADLCSYLGLPRSLKDATKEVYGRDIPKTARDRAKRKHWPDDFTTPQAEEMKSYALQDAQYCWLLWEDLSGDWPEHERAISRITRLRAHQGVRVDKEELLRDLDRLEAVKSRALSKIPWSDSGIVLSHKKIEAYCRDHGIPAPTSVAENSEECSAWEAKYGDAHPIVGSIRDYRKANRLQTVVTSMLERIMPNGRMNFGLKYFGAHTGRWSGGDGLNMQNPNKEPVFGVDIRKRIIAEKGKKFIIADLAQIEPRCTAWLVKDEPMLQALREGFGIYEAFAKSIGLWDGLAGTMKETHKDLYALAKAQVLALSYGCGPAKFILMAKRYADLDLSSDAAKAIVRDYREKNRLITEEWYRLEREMRHDKRCEDPIPDLEVLLPSRRILRYTQVSYIGEDKDGQQTEYKILHARPGYGKESYVWWGGKLFENVVQATARDVLAYAILNLEAAGIPVLWSAHDEVICEVSESFNSSLVKTIMTQTPPWLDGLVLDAEVVESQHYLK